MKLSNLLVENKVDEFKSKFSTKFSEENLNKIVSVIPTRFLMWVGKALDNINFDENLSKVAAAITSFDKISSSLPLTDINQYQSVDQLVDAINSYVTRIRRDYEQVPGGNVVYNDERFFVVNPQTHDASCYYGRGTKWCTASDGDYQFHKHNDTGKLFYILDRTKASNDPEYKVALMRNFDGGLSFFDAKNQLINSGWILRSPEYNQIMDSIESYMKDVYSEQIRIYQDAELKKKETQRIRQLEIQREVSRKQRESEERRENREWELNGDCPDEGIRAHAVLKYLIDTEGAETYTPDEIDEINDLRSQILQMEDDPDFEDEVQEMKDRINDIMSGKIDVYDIVPTGEFYYMSEFEVVNIDFYGQRYAAGDEDEINRSAIESTENLIDDVGYDAFSKSFLESHIDEEEVEQLIERWYEDDISENPEYYVDEQYRQLSDDQIEIIQMDEKRIERIRKEIAYYNDWMDENEYDNDTYEKITARIDKLEDMITELDSNIQDQKDDPEGDFDPDRVQDAIDDMVSDRIGDPLGFLNEYGFDIKDYIDKEGLIDDVISSDGYGHILNSYDGNSDEYKIEGKWIHVIRID